MSDNPYSNYPAERSRVRDEFDETPSRLSITALVAVVLAVPACCGLGLVAGPIAAVLGAVALLFIGRSNGRLGGRGLAATAIILGIISTVAWGAVVYGMYSIVEGYRKTILVPTDEFFQALERGDVKSARGFLSAGASGDVSDEQLVAFYAAAEQELGDYQGAPMDFTKWRDAFTAAYSGKNKPKGGSANNPSPPVPVPLSFNNAPTIVYTLLEPARLQAGVAAADDIMLLLPDGRGLMLRKDGPAKMIANVLAGSGVTAPDLLGGAPSEAAPTEEKKEGEPAPEAPSPPAAPAPVEKPEPAPPPAAPTA